MTYTTQLAVAVPVTWKRRLSELAQQQTIDGPNEVRVSDLVREALDEIYALSISATGKEAANGHEDQA